MLAASVIVPAYNAASSIQACLHALLAQTFSRAQYEIIVVDDGSTDATAQRVEDLHEAVRLVRVLHGGPAAARNWGARAARGEILVFTDADCTPAANWIEALLAPFTDPQTRIVGAKGAYRTSQPELVARFVQLEYEEKYAQLSRVRYIDFIDTYSAAYRRDIFLANGGFDESLLIAEDQEFSFRLAKQGYPLIFVPQAIVYHRHVTSLVAYAARKFRIGYWKARLHRRHPDKIWQDAHTPLTLKLEVGLWFVCLAALLATPFFVWARFLGAFSLLALALTAVPLILFIAQRDWKVAFISPLMIATRAAALGVGLGAGVSGEVWRNSLMYYVAK